MKKSRRTFSGTVEVCCHRVSFWYGIERYRLTGEEEQCLTDDAEERAKECIIDGYHSGELCSVLVRHKPFKEMELRGWWTIES